MVLWISVASEILHSKWFWDSVTNGMIKSTIWLSTIGEEVWYNDEKWSTSKCPILVMSETYWPMEFWRETMSFRLWWMIVDTWKDFVFESVVVSHWIRDFNFQRCSFCFKASWRRLRNLKKKISHVRWATEDFHVINFRGIFFSLAPKVSSLFLGLWAQVRMWTFGPISLHTTVIYHRLIIWSNFFDL